MIVSTSYPFILVALVDGLIKACENRRLRINTGKTEVMGITKGRQKIETIINIKGHRMKQVQRPTYLGSVISDDGCSEQEIKRRIGIAKTSFGRMRNI